MMYLGDLADRITVRLTQKDLDYLRMIAEYRDKTLSEVIRDIVTADRLAWQKGLINDGNEVSDFDDFV